MKTVTGIGEALWDCLPEGRKFGGAPTNFAYHCSQFGLDAWAVSAIGDDEMGDEILDICKGVNLQVICPKMPYETGTVQVTLDEKGIPQYNIKKGVAWDNIPYSEELAQLALRTDAVCFGSLAQRSSVSRDTIRRFIGNMPEDALKVFDINLRQNFFTKEVIEESLNLCNVLKINDEELVTVSHLFGWLPESDEDFETTWKNIDFKSCCCNILTKYNLRMLILTCGVNGSYVFTPDGEISELGTPKVEVADTVGAGDSFTAAFVSSILLGKTVKEAHKCAVDVSAFVRP
ncbi:MAG: carbohydrate kinase [Bacteroidaceae bacterium]|nr:carbohydrate kinase [Bacteroidaceae bacterium]